MLPFQVIFVGRCIPRGQRLTDDASRLLPQVRMLVVRRVQAQSQQRCLPQPPCEQRHVSQAANPPPAAARAVHQRARRDKPVVGFPVVLYSGQQGCVSETRFPHRLVRRRAQQPRRRDEPRGSRRIQLQKILLGTGQQRRRFVLGQIVELSFPLGVNAGHHPLLPGLRGSCGPLVVIAVRYQLMAFLRQPLQPTAKICVRQHVALMMVIGDHQQRAAFHSEQLQLGQHPLERRPCARAHVVQGHHERPTILPQVAGCFGRHLHETAAASLFSSATVPPRLRRRSSIPRSFRHKRRNAMAPAAAAHATENTSPWRV